MPHQANQTSFKKGHKFIKGGEKGWFKKGIVPWNKNKKGIHLSSKSEFKKGQKSWNKGKKYLQIMNEKNPVWKGDKVGYNALHSWIYRKLGKPGTCEQCGKTGLWGRQIHWANKDHKYRRNVKDWIRLCKKCHRIYDNKILLKQKICSKLRKIQQK